MGDQALQASTLTGFRKILSTQKYYWVALAVVLLDQIVKLSVKFNIPLYDDRSIIGDTFRLNFIENDGAAFGLTISDLLEKVGFTMSDETAKLILTLFSLLAIIVIIYLLKQVWNYKSSLPVFVALILGGAVGNIIDRVFYGVWFDAMNYYDGGLLHGRVVDMFYLDIYHGKVAGLEFSLLPVFNVADMAITIGIGVILVFQRRFFKLLPENDAALEPAISDAEMKESQEEE